MKEVLSFRLARVGQRAQRGAVLIMVGLSLIVLIGFAGLAIDLGRFFVVKAELQNAMDACALAAATQLRPGQNDSNALKRAVAYGRVFTTGGTSNMDAIKNFADFQRLVVAITEDQITFSDTVDGTYQSIGSGSGPYNTASYAKCSYPLTGLPIYFAQVLNLLGASYSTQTVSAMAVATRGRSTCNVIPVGVCQRDSSATRGLNPGEWISIGDTIGPGLYGWVDYSTFGGGTSEVKAGLTAVGQCKMPVVGDTAQESGQKTSAQDAWNTRFGIYSNPYRISDISEIPPDKTGYAYFGQDVGTGTNALVANWPRADSATTPRAYNQANSSAPGAPFYQQASDQLRAYEQTTTIFNGKPDIATGGSGNQLDQNGRRDRRLLVLPILDCSVRPMVIRELGCALMLNPFGQVSGRGGGPVNGKLEYLGFVSTVGSPCGNSNTTGPNMSVLVE